MGDQGRRLQNPRPPMSRSALATKRGLEPLCRRPSVMGVGGGAVQSMCNILFITEFGARQGPGGPHVTASPGPWFGCTVSCGGAER